MAKCRICDNKIQKIINFGKIALVGFFSKTVKPNKKFNITLNYCIDCKHVQISEILNPRILFNNYLWETSISKTNIYLLKNLIKRLKEYKLNYNSKVLEIASNDGSLLKLVIQKYKCLVLGVDPAKNLKNNFKHKNFYSITDYFNYNLSEKIRKKFKSFDLIFARNVIAHVPKPNEIFSGVSNLLSKKGIFIIEVPHLLNIIKYNQYDNIFHEHIGFHSLKSIIDLCKKNNLKVFKVEKIDSQGGSLRCFICKKENDKKISKKLKVLVSEEIKLGLFSSKHLKKFKNKILNHINNMQKLIKKLKHNKKKISAYGASGKGQALMQYCNLNSDFIDSVFDKSRLKLGCFTPGTNIKIKHPKYINKQKIDYLLLLSWNLKDEIIKQEKKFTKRGGKFIVPFPKPKIIY